MHYKLLAPPFFHFHSEGAFDLTFRTGRLNLLNRSKEQRGLTEVSYGYVAKVKYVLYITNLVK